MAPLRKPAVRVLLYLTITGLILLSGCGGSSQPDPPPPPPAPSPLSASNLNLIFVATEDVSYQAHGDVNPRTGNLTSRGLQRSLMMATFLQQVLGGSNVNGIYALVPMTHLQTANHYPDMAGLEAMEQFAMLNRTTMSIPGASPVTANSYPVNVSYSSAPLPDDVHAPLINCPALGSSSAYSCQGLDYRDLDGDNEALAGALIQSNTPGFYVFAAPWDTISALMANINRHEGYNLTLPTSYVSPDYIYAIAITPSGTASLVTYDSNINPPSTYPKLPAGGIVAAACLPVQTNTTFQVTVTGGVGGAVVPAGVNTNETIYFIRHGEAHPTAWWEDGNYYGAGQWRALDLPNALRGKIHPNLVYSIDPAQVLPGAESVNGDFYSYVRTNTTVLPYAIANNLPYNLAASFEMMAQNPPAPATQAANFFFFGGRFSNQSVLVGWEHDHIAPTVNALLAAYHGGQSVRAWPGDDYDTVWTVKLDAHGNLSVDNLTCEGISSKALPPTPPQF